MDPIDQEIAALEAKKVYLEAARNYNAAREKMTPQQRNSRKGKQWETYVTTKAELTELRNAWRQLRVSPDGPGDGVANPAAVSVGVTGTDAG